MYFDLTGSLLETAHLLVVLFAIPIMPLATWMGRSINQRLGERYFGILFWLVMLGYAVRLVVYIAS